MKRTIITGLGIIIAVFVCGSAYIIYTIDSATSRLDNMIMLHQVEILRENYLIQLKRVQADLLLQDTRHTRSFDTFVRDAMKMRRKISSCHDCHHDANITERIDALQGRSAEYERALSRVFTIRANAARLQRERDQAFRTGESLIAEVRQMVEMTTANLSDRRSRALEEILKTKYILYVLLATIPLLAGSLVYALVREFANPMRKLLDSMRKLQEGDLDHRVEGMKHEFGELAESINEMAASLKEQMLKMQRTEQMVVLAELAAGLAHEIKNPLAGIKVAMHVLAEETTLAEEDKLVLKRVVEEVSRLESLMRNFLNFAKPQKPQLSPMNINDLLSSTLTFYLRGKSAEEGVRNGIRIEKDFDPLPVATADLIQLQHVFLNLILNAVDAMPEGGTLRIRTRMDTDPGFLRIEISDTGKGLADEDPEKIFQPFYTTKPKGTGLGLAISRQVIESHGGSILAENNPGGGATFRVLLPVSPPTKEMRS